MRANQLFHYSKDASPARTRGSPSAYVAASGHISAVDFPRFRCGVWDGVVDILQGKVICQNLGNRRKPD
jgi:hypothetical protein